MDDEPLPQNENELSSELTGLNKGEKEIKKKQIIIGIASGALLAVLIVIIIIVLSSSKSTNNKNASIIGEINLTYDVSNTLNKTVFLGNDFK